MRSLSGDLLLQRLGEQPDDKLHKRLYNAIRTSILDGSLPPSSRLPASRDLAQELSLSRNTVLTVYEQLLAEGYVSARAGSGTFVADTVPDSCLSTGGAPADGSGQPRRVELSERGAALLHHASASPKQWGAFIPGVPDVNAFPHQLFSKIQARLSRRPAPQRLTYSNQGGSPELQHALVEYLRVARSVRCSPEQILITEGIHQAIDLVTRMLCNPGDDAWIEEPGYWGIRNILRINALNICPLAVDEAGLVPPEQPTTPPRLIFVTPSHQYPLGSVMSLARRQRLLALARNAGGWIVEDDYDSEFRFSGQPIPALQGLEADAPVIYIGTFSKTLYPALRLGYVVLPPPLVQALKTAHAELYRGGHLLIQSALAEFIQAGHYTAHIRRMRLLYARRRAFLTGLIEQHLGKQALSEFNSNAGLHLILNLPDEADDVAIAAAAGARGVLVRPLSRYYMLPNRRRGLLMGFASVPEEQMAAAFTQLLACINAPEMKKAAP
ncbi:MULTISPECIES: PLP-dependent aminotransferase family protein [Serratia]|uniref:MocR-like pyridoxine biosynthesis transcription factor PdxR n=1 Tax=Serratia TaxID=613 RepID=UPI000745637B|nr:PLP-dependent aminotransferase family protein [Serratia marcescens]MBE8813438.1 PLP-dependent aminotransferase family protein [Serratia marcescens]MBS6088774.1 PLP-dependent aminotransferase family protein [Serratia marcescens]MCG5373631.1 PLP-dependent aminotransferase family protein [Serratia marcescens]MDQ9390797.1 PLP-dependent aminotransferase family protein [Serratia marcescens]CAI1768811.1 HTH-type transcriptional regulatory protein gabR [Serratia marcescens]